MEQNVRIAISKTQDILHECGIKVLNKAFREEDKVVVGGEYLPRTIVATLSGNVNLYVFFKEFPNLKKVSEKLVNYFNVTILKDRVVFKYTKKDLEITAIGESAESNKKESVIKKVEKLLALSQDKANEHEAISASLMAQKLLAKYGLSLNDVDGGEKDVPIEEVKVDVGAGNGWRNGLVLAVAHNFRCKAYITDKRIYTFYGYRDDIMTARAVFTYLANTCSRLGKQFVKDKKKAGESADQFTFNNYCIGFVEAVKEELGKQCTELMLVVPDSVEDAFNKKKEEEFSKRGFNPSVKINPNDVDAFVQGKRDGKSALNARYVEDQSGYLTD